jgi:alkylated DNA repair protein (DNA oxidative demethylase)
VTLDLFAEPLIAGLDYRPEFLTRDEQGDLLARLSALDLAPFQFHGWIGNRKTRSFGWRYDFNDASFTPADRIPGWLQPLRDRAAAFAGVPADAIHHALVARYDPGAGIGWHKDRDVFERVVGVSLHSRAMLRFRRRTGDGFRRAALEVEPGSAYLLSGEARWDWEHRITPGEQLRFSITFRTLSEKGRKIASAQRSS